MRVYIDTEFYEFQPERNRVVPLNQLPGANAVQLISIGAVREDGEEFYAENAAFDWDFVPEDHWLQENVRPHLWTERYNKGKPMWLVTEGQRPAGGYLSPGDIAQRFRLFAAPDRSTPDDEEQGYINFEHPEFWGYFCDYDWVVLCGLYGRMVDLPDEFPMYCNDLKQEMARRGVTRRDLPKQSEQAHHALADARWVHNAHIATTMRSG